MSRRSLWTSRRVVDSIDITYRQLDYWCRLGAITPTVDCDGSGTRRGWSRSDVHRLAMIDEIVAHVGTSKRIISIVWETLGPEFDVTDPAEFYIWREPLQGLALFGVTMPANVRVGTVIRSGWPDPLAGVEADAVGPWFRFLDLQTAP